MTGSLAEELHRFEHLLATRFPDALDAMNDGLDDDGIRRLRETVAPYRVPADVETLYRWRAGGPPVFAGWRMHGLDDLAEQRRFGIDDLEHPPVWLALFDDHGAGFVELTADETPSSPSVWSADSHGTEACRMHDSLTAFIATCSDLIEADRLVEYPGHNIISKSDTIEGAHREEAIRLSHSPTAYRWPDPPEGSVVSKFADHTWPESWLESIGQPASVRRLRGASHTIEQVLSICTDRQVEATIVGRLAGPAIFAPDWSEFTFTDGTGELAVSTDSRTVGNSHSTEQVEIDIVVERGARPKESGPRVPQGVPAVATAIREIVGG